MAGEWQIWRKERISAKTDNLKDSQNVNNNTLPRDLERGQRNLVLFRI
jgi:hypothetical protein